MSSFQYTHIHLENDVDLIHRTSAEIEESISDAIAKRGHCVIGCSGGSTPRRVYEELGSLVSIEWDKVTVFLVDERYVPSDHEESNQRLLKETLLKENRIDEHRLIMPDTSLALDECVEDYDFRLSQLIDEKGIDMVILGMGEDGHIASLFPGDMDALLEDNRTVIHTRTDRFAIHDRMTATLPVLRDARKQFFLLRGSPKKRIFSEVLSENTDIIEYPAHMILETGRSIWLTRW